MGLWTRYLRWRQRHVPRLEVGEQGFSVFHYGRDPATMDWTDIATVHAFKRDLYVVDMVCLLIAGQDGSAIEVNEEMPGYPALIERIDAMPGTRPAWQLEVMFPAFALNPTQIYLAPTPPAASGA